MRLEPEVSGVSIVLIGSFNPRIFHPEWFARNGIITDREKESADVEIIHPQMAVVRWEPVSIRVELHRFIAETLEAPFIKLSDLVVKTFKEYLSHTPINKMGINRLVHFSVGDEDIRNQIGKMLAPHKPWGEWAGSIEGRSKDKRGGMLSLTMHQQDLDDRKQGYIRAQIGPSPEIKYGAGIFMEINDHYEADNPSENQGCEEIVGLLERQFETSIKRSEWIIDQIMALKERL